MPPTPDRKALRSTEESRTRAAEVTPEDLALLASQVPPAVRRYVEAEPEEEPTDE